MKDRITSHVLANTAMMRSPRRRHLPVLLLQIGIDTASIGCPCRHEDYWVLPAPDRETAIRARAILKGRGWTDHEVPRQFEQISFGMTPPSGSENAASNESDDPSANKETHDIESGVSRDTITKGDEGVHHPPNALALAILKEVRERQKGRRTTDPSHTQELIREARSGGVYGYDPTE
jgi:hypothetical protein